ncbi:hypothetical protein GCM10009090_06650 [[Pseudomonas] boreopolis]|uniref:Uncharacterized protein n=1 Tax=Xanthomonas boreopolis TaxID=86183 RepID=A0A919KGJ8_9XANT|nr:hypothetical protein GCM10009090_06650 [[Pseudomonas] boreopolis]
MLLIDLDVQPTLSSYYPLAHQAPAGVYELLAFNERAPDKLLSHTRIARLDVVLSNDDKGQLNTCCCTHPRRSAAGLARAAQRLP